MELRQYRCIREMTVSEVVKILISVVFLLSCTAGASITILKFFRRKDSNWSESIAADLLELRAEARPRFGALYANVLFTVQMLSVMLFFGWYCFFQLLRSLFYRRAVVNEHAARNVLNASLIFHVR